MTDPITLGIAALILLVALIAIRMPIAYAMILAFDPRLRRYRLFGRWWRPEWPRLREVARLGAPIALSVTFDCDSRVDGSPAARIRAVCSQTLSAMSSTPALRFAALSR